jgi:hypothetical protein
VERKGGDRVPPDPSTTYDGEAVPRVGGTGIRAEIFVEISTGARGG